MRDASILFEALTEKAITDSNLYNKLAEACFLPNLSVASVNDLILLLLGLSRVQNTRVLRRLERELLEKVESLLCEKTCNQVLLRFLSAVTKKTDSQRVALAVKIWRILQLDLLNLADISSLRVCLHALDGFSPEKALLETQVNELLETSSLLEIFTQIRISASKDLRFREVEEKVLHKFTERLKEARVEDLFPFFNPLEILDFCQDPVVLKLLGDWALAVTSAGMARNHKFNRHHLTSITANQLIKLENHPQSDEIIQNYVVLRACRRAIPGPALEPAQE